MILMNCALAASALVRPSGDAKFIASLAEYAESTRRSMQQGAQRGVRARIGLRFTERFANANAASERGVYELTLTNAEGESSRVYARFHDFPRKEDERWKILVDYDSTEGGTINAASYLAAHAADDYARFRPKAALSAVAGETADSVQLIIQLLHRAERDPQRRNRPLLSPRGDRSPQATRGARRRQARSTRSGFPGRVEWPQGPRSGP